MEETKKVNYKKTEELIRIEFDDAQIANFKTSLSSNLIKADAIDKELSEIKATYKVKLDELKTEKKQLLRNIRLGFDDQYMNVNNVPNDEKGIIEFCDEEGTVLGFRQMTSEERPSIIFKMSQEQ